MDCMFRVNLYDQDGDLSEPCIILCLNRGGNDTGLMLQFRDLAEVDGFVDSIQKCVAEIKETYPNELVKKGEGK